MFLVDFRCTNTELQSFFLLDEIAYVQSNELGSPERTCKSDQEQRAISKADQTVRRCLHHGTYAIGGKRRLPVRRDPDRSADAAQSGFHHFRLGRRLMSREQMGVADARDPPCDAGGFAAALSFASDECGERCGCCRQGAQIACLAPLTEQMEIAAVGAPAVLGLFGTGETEGESEFVGGRIGGEGVLLVLEAEGRMRLAPIIVIIGGQCVWADASIFEGR